MSLRVIGAGLGRTGTASLKVALEQLGLGRCYHMVEVLSKPADAALWLRAAGGAPDWERLLGDYGAAVDYPACNFWRELAARYPSAKILLSVRDADDWFESTQATIFSPKLMKWMRRSPFGEFLEKTTWSEFDGRIHDRDFMVAYFERRIEEIRREVPARRLLVYEAKQGWKPLCEFLGLPVPDTPFPRVNSREDTARMIESIITASAETSIEERLQERAGDLFAEKRDER